MEIRYAVFKETVTFRNNLGKFTDGSFWQEKSNIIRSCVRKSTPVYGVGSL